MTRNECKKLDLAVVIVNWNTGQLLQQCVASIYAYAPHCSFGVWVVDNGSHDGSAEMVRANFPNVHLVVKEANLGFTKAFNDVLRHTRAEYVVSLHPDTEVMAGALQAMIDYMESHPEVATIGAKLVYPDGEWNKSWFDFPTLATELSKALLLHRLFPASQTLNRTAMTPGIASQRWAHHVLQSVGWVSSACLLLRREIIQTIGLLDEHYLVWWADVDWCYQVHKAGWCVHYLPQAKVVHYERRSFRSGAQHFDPHLAYKEKDYLPTEMTCRNIIYFFRKNYGRREAVLLRAILAVGYFTRVVACCAALALLPPRRVEARERLLNYWQGLRVALAYGG